MCVCLQMPTEGSGCSQHSRDWAAQTKLVPEKGPGVSALLFVPIVALVCHSLQGGTDAYRGQKAGLKRLLKR